MQNQFSAAINQICDEKRIDPESVITAIEAAMVAAYRRDYGEKGEEFEASLDRVTGGISIAKIKHVVEEVIDPMDIIEERRIAAEEAALAAEEAAEAAKSEDKDETAEELEGELVEVAKEATPEVSEDDDEEAVPLLALEAQIHIDDAKSIDPTIELGGLIREDVTPTTYGRIAAQTAKQVIMQRVREAERNSMYDIYKDKEGEILNAVVSRVEPNGDAYIEADRNMLLMQKRHQIDGEQLRNGQRMKVLVGHVEKTNKGPQIVITRKSPQLVLRLLEMEVPEIVEGSVEVVNVAREAGVRTKIAVRASEKGVDPVGSCVGQKGIRIQNITDELNDERIDIIEYKDDITDYLVSTLSPANIISIELDEEKKLAKVYVTVDQRSLAIGKKGQNVRLASMITGWEIDILDWVAGSDKGTMIKSKDDDDEDDDDDDDVLKPSAPSEDDDGVIKPTA